MDQHAHLLSASARLSTPLIKADYQQIFYWQCACDKRLSAPTKHIEMLGDSNKQIRCHITKISTVLSLSFASIKLPVHIPNVNIIAFYAFSIVQDPILICDLAQVPKALNGCVQRGVIEDFVDTGHFPTPKLGTILEHFWCRGTDFGWRSLGILQG